MNGSRQDVELDKSLYNDFEADHLDSYVVKLNIPLSIDEISHFEIIRDGGFDWQMAYVKVFSLESGDYLAGNDQTQLVDEDIPVLIQKDQKWETKPTNTWHAPIQNGKLTVNKLTITIKTSDDFLSGTNDDVFFHIHYLTDAGAQAELTTELDTDWHDDFEMDQIDSYDYQLDVPIPLDKFLYFEIKKKGKDDWVIDWIKVCDADSGKQIAAVESQHKIESDEGYIRINVK